MKEQQMLVACVAPWVGREHGDENLDLLLPLVAEKARSIIRDQGISSSSGKWYGVLVQTTTLVDGRRATFIDYLQTTFPRTGNQFTAEGELFTGQRLTWQGQREGGKMKGTVMNLTAGLASEFSCVETPTMLSGSYTGSGAGQTFEGTFTCVR